MLTAWYAASPGAVGRDHDVRVDRLHAQHDVVEVTRGIGVFDDLLDLIPITRQLARQQPGGARAEQRLLVDDHHGLGGLAGRGIQYVQIGDCRFCAFFVAGAKTEGVFEAPLHDLVGHAHIHDVREVVFGGRLRRGQTDGRCEGADHSRYACLVHLLYFCGTRLRLRLGITQQGLDLGATQGLDAAGLVDVLDGHHRALTALLARVGQCTGHRVQHTDLDGLCLCPAHQWEGHCRRCGGRLGHEMAASTHGHSPGKDGVVWR